MAGSREIRCVGPSAQLTDRKAAVQRAVNMYLEQIDGLGEARQLMLVSAPGLSATDGISGVGVFRGARNVLGRLFLAVGSSLVEANMVDGCLTLVSGVIATLATSEGFVGMANNATQLAVVDGVNLYVMTIATRAVTTITAATNAAWLTSDDVHELDGYAVFTKPGADVFFISASDDFTSLDALDFSSADSIADAIVAHRVFNSEIWLFGDVSTEVWINNGGSDFPFARYASAPLPIGIVGPRAAVIATSAIFWIGKTEKGRGIVYRATAHAPRRVSTPAVEKALASSLYLADAKLWTYQIEGHEFIGIDVPDIATTWVYDEATQQWHERGKLINGEWSPMTIEQVVFFGDKHYACKRRDYNNDDEILCLDSASYHYAPNFSNEDATPFQLVRERTWPHLVSPSMEPISYRSLELACMTGYGGVVTLEISNDGGMTYGPPIPCSLGEIGHYTQRVRWHGLGSASDRVFRLRVSDQVPFSIYDAAVDAG